jgi:predicted phage tail protein
MAMETMTAEQAAEWGKTLDFPTVWATIQELAKERKEAQRETDKKFQETAEQMQETDRQMQESKAEHDRMIAEMREEMKELSKNVGGLNGSLGDMAEGLMASDLYEHFAAQGLEFDSSFQNYVLKDKKTKLPLAEVDMLLVNGTIALAVEAKTTMTRGDVAKHEKRLEILRSVPNSLFANRKLYGAMAAVKTSRKAREHAIEKGFFVIELSGGTVRINMPEGFKPKTW